MMRALYTASSGMTAQQLNVDTIAHNVSNVNTTGFKKQRVEFQDLLYQTIKRPTVTATQNQPTGLSVGLGVKPVDIDTNFSQGSPVETDVSTDVAINGPGFFEIQVPGHYDPLYTRDGSFKVDADGQLVTAEGYLVLGVDPMDEGATDITIDKQGNVSYTLPDGTTNDAGQILIATFSNPAGLQKLGSNLYQATANSGDPVDWDPDTDSTISLQSDYLESSNVQVVDEMVDLITAQRAYDMNSKVIQASDEMLQTAANLRR